MSKLIKTILHEKILGVKKLGVGGTQETFIIVARSLRNSITHIRELMLYPYFKKSENRNSFFVRK